MINIGFIGFGSMGSLLVKGFINSGLVHQEQIIVTREDKNRLNEIKNVWPDINTTWSNTEIVKAAKYIFICVKPLQYKNILIEIEPYISEEKHIISIAGSVTIENIESIINCKITKVMPTIVSEVNGGIFLACHNSKVTSEDAVFIESLIENISKIKLIDEKDFGFASELTSCAPGFIAAVFQELVEAGQRHTDSFKKEDIVDMVLQTLYGTARLMLERKMNFDDIISRVATKGGITEEGVKVLKAGLPQVFDEMFNQTLNKRKIVSDKVNEAYENGG
jgi:pyrroline-5-carboxylate reductase